VVVTRYMAVPLIGATVLLAAACARVPKAHFCNDADIQRFVARGQFPPDHYRFRVTTDGDGVKFSGSETTLKITASYFDSNGSCTISPDKLTVTWMPWKPGDEMPLTPNGARAVFRPTHPREYAFNATVEYAPLVPWSGMLPPLPVITHEQNAIGHLNDLLDAVYGFNPQKNFRRRADLQHASEPLSVAYRSLYTNDSAEAIRQLGVFRTQAGSHASDPRWADILSETDNVIAGIQQGDHRFDALPLAHGIYF